MANEVEIIFDDQDPDIYIDHDERTYIFYYSWRDRRENIKFMDEIIKKGTESSLSTLNELLTCDCGKTLDSGYLYIIHSLNKAGLLPKDYKPMCCFCNILACIGFRVPDEWGVTVIEPRFDVGNRDLAIIHITFDYRIPGFNIIEKCCKLEIRVHDVEKTIKTGRIINDVNVF